METPILQFGTSRFLQAHVDLFVSEALQRGEALGKITVVQTTSSPESRKRLEGRLALEKVLSDWTYVVDAKQLEPLLKTREQMVAQKKAEGDGAEQSSRTSSKGVKRK